ncbi:MAG TPA: MATE family efflux transporter, partial [Bacteroidota bacterium]
IDLFSSDPVVSVAAADYIKYRSIGLPFFLLAVSYRGFFYGIGQTHMFMFSAIITYVFNIVFNYLLIFGKFGFPKMGVAGAGVAASVGMVAGFIFFIVVTFFPEYRRKYRYYDVWAIGLRYLQPIIRISLPVSFQNILILFGFLVFVAITGIIGTPEQAATQVVITSLYLSFMPCFGFGIAAQTLVGNALGNNDANEAYRYGAETAKLGTMFTLAVGIVFVAAPDVVLMIITNNDSVIEVARPLLQLAGVAQVAYGSGIIIANALQAAGDTLYVMYLEIVTHWIIFLPAAYVMGVTLDLGILGAWAGLPVYVLLYTTIAWIKFRSGSWKTIKV